jgi:hypothetical protein
MKITTYILTIIPNHLKSPFQMEAAGYYEKIRDILLLIIIYCFAIKRPELVRPFNITLLQFPARLLRLSWLP